MSKETSLIVLLAIVAGTILGLATLPSPPVSEADQEMVRCLIFHDVENDPDRAYIVPMEGRWQIKTGRIKNQYESWYDYRVEIGRAYFHVEANGISLDVRPRKECKP